jgi:hypothetical protein
METGASSLDDLKLTEPQRKAVGFLAEFSKRMVVLALSDEKTAESASTSIMEIYRVIDELLNGCLKSGQELPCKIGCYWCCCLKVKVTPLEVVCISDYLHARLEPQEFRALQKRLVRTDKITRGMDGNQRVRAIIRCPLLLDGKCLAYSVRPIACRVYHSLDMSACKSFHGHGRSMLTIRQDISRIGLGIFVGLTEGLRSVDLPTRLLELITGLRIAVEQPKHVVLKQWLSNDAVFGAAEIANAKQIENFHRRLVEELGVSLDWV